MREWHPSLVRCLHFVAALILLFLLSPLLLIIGIVIRLDSRDPVFFRQKRIGKDGKEFILWKFRSMLPTSDPYASSPRNEHPDITPFGRWLRNHGLDELPQLFNVVLGDMNLVGPRPEMPFVVDKYDEKHMKRLSVEPGITGLWQLFGPRDCFIHDHIGYDIAYVRNRCLWLDLKILVASMWVAFFGLGSVSRSLFWRRLLVEEIRP